jgi:micrococcal nuclease
MRLAGFAKARMAELIETPGLSVEDSGEVDVFERPLVVLRLPDGSTVGQRLIEEGYAAVWTPDYQANWCD